MIIYHNQLMKNERELRLFLVSNPVPFARFEDHEAALQIQVYEMVERALQEKENPIALLESYLGITYTGGTSSDDIADFLLNTSHMVHAFHGLRENYKEMNEKAEENSLLYATTTREEAVASFSSLTLRSYLEALATVFDE